MRILLVRLRQIGDVVFTTPAIAALAHRFPGAELSYLVEPEAAPIVAANPHLCQVLVAPRRAGATGVMADLRLGARLRRQHYDLAIDFHGGPRASLLTWLSRAPVRIGYEVAGRSWMYTRVVARPKALRRRHSVENQWDLIAGLGIAPPTPESNPVEMPADPDAARRIRARLAASGVTSRDELAVVHISATSPFRRWPPSGFVDTIVALAASPRRRVVVTAGPSDRSAAQLVIAAAHARLSGEASRRILTGDDLSLAELRALLEQSAVYIGGDSGPLHVAATTRVPIVGLFGPTPSERSKPWRSPTYRSEVVEIDGLPCRPCNQRVCAPGDFRCLTWIGAASVIAAAERLLVGRPQLDYDR
jgi:lipopolysaccharide heptosyltransferase II